MKKHDLFSRVGIFLFSSGIWSQPASFIFRNLTTNDGLSGGYLRSITKTNMALYGLIIYNGYIIKVLEHMPGDSFPYVKMQGQHFAATVAERCG